MHHLEDDKPTARYERGGESQRGVGSTVSDRARGNRGRRATGQSNASSEAGAGGAGPGRRKPAGPGDARRAPAESRRRQRSGGGQVSTLQYGEEIGEYVITGFAGKGATSFVYRARPRHSFEPVALKVLHPSMVADPTRRKAFFKEARMMLQLDHDNVVEFQRILEEDGYIAFVMEYIEGDTLESWLQQYRGRIDQATIAALFADILRGVRHAHENGVIHRDLKPSNVMITRQAGDEEREDGRVSAKIIDFGIAREAGEQPSRIDRERIRGTAAYMSPEEVESPEEVCEASDLYSIGVMLYEAAAGTRPFESSDPRQVMRAHADRSPASPSQYNPTLAPELEFVILKTLAKSPNRRFANAREMIAALELGIRGMQSAGSPGTGGGVDIEQVVKTSEWSRPDHLEGADGEDIDRWHRQLLSWLGMVVTILTATGRTGGEHDPHFLSRDDDISTRGGL